jgi:hypothetical protein
MEAGLEPFPYTLEDLEDDKDTLAVTVPAFRADPGWQTERAQATLDRWEQDARDNLARHGPRLA